VTVVHKEHYLRGRSMQDLEDHLRVGLARVGVGEVDSYPTELDGLRALVSTGSDGDVLAMMCHADRGLLHDWLTTHGGTVDDAAVLRRKVVAARGEHEAEEALAALRAETDTAARLQQAQAWWGAHPQDPRLAFELAEAHDAAGKEREAIRWYDEALALGLREPHRHRALIQKASDLRRLGELDQAADLLDDLARRRPGSAAVAAFRALVRCDAGETRRAVADLIEALLAHAGDADDDAYREVLHRLARELR
jgi:cyanophycin synthetase